jgi:hypothetical protein
LPAAQDAQASPTRRQPRPLRLDGLRVEATRQATAATTAAPVVPTSSTTNFTQSLDANAATSPKAITAAMAASHASVRRSLTM